MFADILTLISVRMVSACVVPSLRMRTCAVAIGITKLYCRSKTHKGGGTRPQHRRTVSHTRNCSSCAVSIVVRVIAKRRTARASFSPWIAESDGPAWCNPTQASSVYIACMTASCSSASLCTYWAIGHPVSIFLGYWPPLFPSSRTATVPSLSSVGVIHGVWPCTNGIINGWVLRDHLVHPPGFYDWIARIFRYLSASDEGLEGPLRKRFAKECERKRQHRAVNNEWEDMKGC